jgi:hypothetical protein
MNIKFQLFYSIVYIIITKYKYPYNNNFHITKPWRDKVNDRGGHGKGPYETVYRNVEYHALLLKDSFRVLE